VIHEARLKFKRRGGFEAGGRRRYRTRKEFRPTHEPNNILSYSDRDS
jgi:hypothetical protein